MSKKKQTTGMIVIGSEAPITDVLTKLGQAKASFQKISETPYKSTGEGISGFGNIKLETSIDALVKHLAAIEAKREFHEKASVIILGSGENIKIPVFNLNGNSYEDLLHDICLRAKVLSFKERYDKLQEFEERVRGFLSEQDQKNILFNEINEFLS